MYVLCLSTYLSAAFEHYPADPAAVGSGLITINIQANATGIFADPASVTSFQNRHVGVSSGKRFGLSLLKHQSAALAFPVKNGYAAFGASIFGDEHYSEKMWCLIMGRQFSDRLSIGMGLMYYDLQIKNYGQAGSWGINVGWNMKLDDTLYWRGYWRNINGPTIGSARESLPQVLVSALTYTPIPQANVIVEWEQDTIYDSRVKFGGQFNLLPWVTIHTGHAISPGQTTAGIEINYKQIIINYALSTHSHLDLSHWLGLGFSFR